MEEENEQFPKSLSLNDTSIQSHSSFDSEYNNNNNNNINFIKDDEEGNNIIKEEKNINNKIITNNNINFRTNIFNINNNDDPNKNPNLINNEYNSYPKDGNLLINNIFFNMMRQNICSSNNNKNNIDINIINYNKDKILNNLKNYWGSIYLQGKISYMNDKDISILLNIILPNINDIMCLEFGNYFFQKLIKRLNVWQKLAIYQKMQPYFLNIAKDKNGTHSIQSLIDEIKTTNEQTSLDVLLNQNMLLLFNDKNAYHIIMKLIIERPEEQRNKINIFLIDNIKKIAVNPYGSYCVNKFIVNNTDLKLRSLLLNNIHKNINILFYHKCSCSILLLLLKYYNISSCNFIFSEIQNQVY